MLARVYTSAVHGVGAFSVDVETEIRDGKNFFAMVGLGDNAVKEAKERIESALRYSGFQLPNRLLVNLAPAEIKKEGSSFDLAIAISILSASRQISYKGSLDCGFYGELSLDGSLKPVKGLVAMLLEAVEQGVDTVVVPLANSKEAALIEGINIIPARNLVEVISFLRGDSSFIPIVPNTSHEKFIQKDFSDVRGQDLAKRAMLIAAAGGHNLLMLGPPGCGKSMLAERFSCLLPELTTKEAQSVVKIHSAVGLPIEKILAGIRPYRNPHHGISEAGLVGGGSPPRPGEISLAHKGVLFLDELPEFRRSVIEALRSPLETHKVAIARVKGSITFHAQFQLLAAMNPCPCGRLGVPNVQCLCGQHDINNYIKKISQPILDRIDLHVELDAVPADKLRSLPITNDVKAKQNAVIECHQRAIKRQGIINSLMSNKQIEQVVRISDNALKILDRSAKSGLINARGYFRIIKVAQTIADLSKSDEVKAEHMSEALTFRLMERLQGQKLSSVA